MDLVDRLLNKGLVLNADLIITVAGIPMIGLHLNAALASIETMLDYGMMEAWDRSTRDWYSRELDKSGPSLDCGEELRFRSFGYLWKDEGLYRAWVPGMWHITDRRLMLWRREPGEMVFELPLEEIDGLSECRERAFIGDSYEFELHFKGDSARICLSNGQELRRALERFTGLRALD